MSISSFDDSLEFGGPGRVHSLFENDFPGVRVNLGGGHVEPVVVREDEGDHAQTAQVFYPEAVLDIDYTVRLPPTPNDGLKKVRFEEEARPPQTDSSRLTKINDAIIKVVGFGKGSIYRSAVDWSWKKREDSIRRHWSSSAFTKAFARRHRVFFGGRPRARGKDTNELERILDTSSAGAVSAGLERKRSGGVQTSNVASSWLRALCQVSGAKVVENHQVEFGEGDKVVKDQTIYISMGSGDLCLSLGLYARLYSYACFKPRTQELIPSLRARAVQTCKELGYPADYSAFVLAGTVAMAHTIIPLEASAWRALGGETGRKSAVLSRDLAAGVVPGARLPASHNAVGGTSARGIFTIRSRADWWCALIAGGARTQMRTLPRAVR
uniref:Uncharacterized protein n=1 Tax=Diaporthe helianthi umbravirus 1 TaxID=3077439 RepID=A0AA96H9R6_9TOMB|nr:MAG: hypothetical protein [Diaporthe helianthi umbravirus 1]